MYVSKMRTRFEFFLSRFTYEAVLILNLVVIDAEFYRLSIVLIFRGGHRVKIGGRCFTLNTRQKSTFHQFSLSGFAFEAVLILILVALDVEFYALSNDVIFNGDH